MSEYEDLINQRAARTVGDKYADLDDSNLPVPIVIKASAVKAEKVEWFWRYRIPRGKIFLLSGDPGLGKSTLCLDFAARCTTGRPFPDGTPVPKGGAIILTAEDGYADTVRPRLEAMGADLERVVFFDRVRCGDRERPPTFPTDLIALRQVIDDTGAVLVAIDPLDCFQDRKVNPWMTSEVRQALSPFKPLAEQTGCTIIFVRHLSKGNAGKAIYRGANSIAYTGAARGEYIVAKHPEDDALRVFAEVKANLARPQPSLTYQLVADSADGPAKVQWGEPTSYSADALSIGDTADKGVLQEAREFLRGELAAGARAVKEIQRAANDAGFAWATVRLAKEGLGVASRKVGSFKDGRWEWEMRDPADDRDYKRVERDALEEEAA